jgi:putative ABC transport system permease protein
MSPQAVSLAAGPPLTPSTVESVLRDAWGNLMALRQRSALALIGIVVGTAAVVAMLSIGRMAAEQALKPFLAMGVDLLSVQATSPDSQLQSLDLATVLDLPRQAPGVQAATAYRVGQQRTDIDPLSPPPAILAALPNLADIAGLKLEAGRFLSESDAEALVAVLGAAVAHPSDGRRGAVSLGDQVRAGGYLYRVVGVLRPTPHNGLAPTDFDRSVLIPLASARRSLDGPDPTGALVRMSATADEKMVADAVSAALTRGSDRIILRNARDAVAALKAQKSANTRLLAALAGISLLVGGLGIMNVMLMSMMERRQEIGLRAAVGATPRDIQLMFLAEALVLAAAGGLLGSVLGAGIAYLAAVLSHWPFRLAIYAIPLGVAVAITVGVLFGLYPAIKAANLDPIEALRAE